MSSVKWIIGMLALGIIVYFVLAEKGKKTSTITDDSIETESAVKVAKRFDENGVLKSDVELVNGVRQGIAHNYYNDGSVHTLIKYSNNKREGLSTWFYENGKPYRETPYANDKKQGVQKKYYKSGQIMAEIPYDKDELQPGTKEFSEMGTPIDKEIRLNYSLKKVDSPQITIIEITGKDLKDVIDYKAFYYQAKNKIAISAEREKQAIRFKIQSKAVDIQNIEVFVWLTVKTNMNNKKIIENKIDVVFDKK